MFPGMRAGRVITVVGCHAGGEIGNVVTGGVLPPPGATVFEQMQALRRDGDGLRKLLLHEPRGSVACHANLVVPATRPDCDAGFIIMEPTEYPPMSGSNTICTATVLLETGMVEMHEPETTLRLEAPGGVVEVRAACRDGRCESVELTNVACFAAHARRRRSRSPAWARSRSTSATAACGTPSPTPARSGSRSSRARPATCRSPASASGSPRASSSSASTRTTPRSRASASSQIAGPWQGVGEVSRNAVVVAPGRLDRSACGTGLCARMAALHARGLMRPGDGMTHASAIGTTFAGRIVSEATGG